MRGFSFRSTSPVDGAPLVTILTRGSDNPKTGDVVQSWILREDVEPREALASGQDESICGSCSQRPFLGGRCYVRLFQGPVNIWKAYHRGSYEPFPCDGWLDSLRRWAAGRPLRLGSYGDPAMVPTDLWWKMIAAIGQKLWTGFTHQWREPWAQGHRALCMASVESPEEAEEAQAAGWRTFRTMLREGPLRPNEFHCPASKREGKRLTCRRCAACHGNPQGRDATRVGSVAIIEHGYRTRAALREMEAE